MGQGSSQVTDEQENSPRKPDSNFAIDFESIRRALGIETPRKETRDNKVATTIDTTDNATGDGDLVSGAPSPGNGDGNHVKDTMRSSPPSEGFGGRSYEGNEIDDEDGDNQLTPKPGNVTSNQDTPMIDGPPESSSVPSTDSSSAEPTTATPPLPLQPTRKRKLSRILPGQALATSSHDSEEGHLGGDGHEAPSPFDPLHKRRREVATAVNVPARQSSLRDWISSRSSSIAPGNDPPSFASSQKTPGSYSKQRRRPAVSNTLITSGAPSSTPRKPNGFYTPEEYQAVENFKTQFCNLHSISSDKFNQLIQHSSRDKIEFPLPKRSIAKQEFWNSIYAVLPHRNKVSMARFMRRHFQASEQKRHKWSDEQEKELATLYEQMGPKWANIANILGRTTDDVTQRWKNRVEHRDIQRGGPWSEEECEELEEALQKCRTLLLEDGRDVGTDLFELDEGLIGWGMVSNMMGNKRSRQQCADKWRRIRRKSLRDRSHGDGDATLGKGEKGQPRINSGTPKTPTPHTSKASSTARKYNGWSHQQAAKTPSRSKNGRLAAKSSEYVRDYDSEEDPVVPNTPSSTGAANQGPSVESPILGSALPEDRGQKMDDEDHGTIVTTTTRKNEENKENGVSTQRRESLEIPETPAGQSQYEGEGRAGEITKQKQLAEAIEKENEEREIIDISGDDSDVIEAIVPTEVSRRSTPSLEPDVEKLNYPTQYKESSSEHSSSDSDSSDSKRRDSSSSSDSSSDDSNSDDSSDNSSSDSSSDDSNSDDSSDDSSSDSSSRGDSSDDSSEDSSNDSSGGGDDSSDDSSNDDSSSGDSSSEESWEMERRLKREKREKREKSKKNKGEDQRKKHGENTATTVPERRSSPVIKLENKDEEPPFFTNPPPPSINHFRPQTPSTPGRNSLSSLRMTYRLSSVPVKVERQSPSLKAVHDLNKFNIMHALKDATSTSESKSDKDRGNSTVGGSAKETKLTTNRAANVTAASKDLNPKANASTTMPRRNSKGVRALNAPPPPSQLKGILKRNDNPTIMNHTPRQSHDGRSVSRNAAADSSGLADYLGSAKINGISGVNANIDDSASTNSEAGDIPFSSR